jgi:hypothetical protein
MRERPGERHADPTATAGTEPTGTGPTGAAADPAVPEPAEALATLITKLRAELAGVRTAMRNRAVIEQAKGVLVERLRVTADEGFDQLVQLSQQTNIKLIEVAAAIVGTTAPDPGGIDVTEPTESRPPVTDLIDERLRDQVKRGRDRAAVAARRPGRPPAHEALQAQYQLGSSRIAASHTYNEITEAVAGATAASSPPDTVVITLLEPDGAHRFVGGYGMNPADRTEWSRVPPQFDLPIVAAARDRTALLLTDPAVIADRYPSITNDRYAVGSVFAAPLFDGDRVLGALGLAWRERLDLDPDSRRYLGALAGPVARRTAELMAAAAERGTGALGEGRDDDAGTWLPMVLETVADPAAVLAPMWQDGRIVDFRIEQANGPAAALTSPAGEDASLLTVYPRVGSELLLPHFAALLRDGGQVRLGPARMDPPPTRSGRSAPPPVPLMTVRAGRLWDRVLMVWRLNAEGELIYPQLVEAERIARIGSFRWDLDSTEPRCSPQLYRMYFGDDKPGPVRVDDLAGAVHDNDLPALRDAVRRTLVDGKQLSREFRGAGRLAGRQLRIVAEPLPRPAMGTGAGRPANRSTVVAIHGTVQDVTEERAMAGRLRLAEEALAAQQRRVDAELRAAQALQRALLPTDPELAATDGLWVTGRSRASEHSGRVDGDWYDAFAVPGGATLLVVGDVAGSGLAAMTAAARLRYAVRAYAGLDMAPAEILDAVNTMLCALEPERTATLIVARYSAHLHRLRWAAAGQAAPVRYQRDGRAEVLAGPLGLPVGAAPGVRYSDTAVDLATGDRLLLYTDGLVGGRGTDLVGALDALLSAGAHAGRDDVEALVSHVLGALYAGPDADMGAMLVRLTS